MDKSGKGNVLAHVIGKASDNSNRGKAWSRNSNRMNGQQAQETCSTLLIIREM